MQSDLQYIEHTMLKWHRIRLIYRSIVILSITYIAFKTDLLNGDRYSISYISVLILIIIFLLIYSKPKLLLDEINKAYQSKSYDNQILSNMESITGPNIGFIQLSDSIDFIPLKSNLKDESFTIPSNDLKSLKINKNKDRIYFQLNDKSYNLKVKDSDKAIAQIREHIEKLSK